ncbi:hypothetical protein Nepgr_019475 [Nepenthes gracilis]|uniref:Uncharacterized protein n=1 Tax=Nepenthes gracilis TaxID=150966 RepID=A0AAD3SVC9_NEPGR|nr:hypothetical protein Nepgr_019475 [Nepenthes gracilis]
MGLATIAPEAAMAGARRSTSRGGAQQLLPPRLLKESSCATPTSPSRLAFSVLMSSAKSFGPVRPHPVNLLEKC